MYMETFYESHKALSAEIEAPCWYDLGGSDPGPCHATLYWMSHFLAFSIQEDLAMVSEKGYYYVEFKFLLLIGPESVEVKGMV